MNDYLLKEECYNIIGCCMEVHKELGSGFSENVYKDALEWELERNGIPFKREVKFKVRYKGKILPHFYYADFVIYDCLILEAKAVSELIGAHYEQTINYLSVSDLEVGLLVNFRQPKLQYKRVIKTKEERRLVSDAYRE